MGWYEDKHLLTFEGTSLLCLYSQEQIKTSLKALRRIDPPYSFSLVCFLFRRTQKDEGALVEMEISLYFLKVRVRREFDVRSKQYRKCRILASVRNND